MPVSLKPWTFPRRSIRTLLVISNTMALAVLLCSLGLVVHFATQSTLIASIDHQLDVSTTATFIMTQSGPSANQPGFIVTAHGGSSSIGFTHPPGIGGVAIGTGSPIEPMASVERGDRRFSGPLPEGGAVGIGGPGPITGGGVMFQGPPPPVPMNSREFREADQFRPRIFGLDGRSIDRLTNYAPWSRSAFIQSRAGEVANATVSIDGQPYRVLSRPIPGIGHPQGVVQNVYPLADIERAMSGVDRVLWILSPVALLYAAFAGWLLTGRVLSRVRHITHAAATIGAQDFSRRIPVSGSDEFSELAETFNGMLGRLQTTIEQQRRFTADASHELKTPLTVIQGNTEMALTGEPSRAELCDALSEIDQAASSMSVLVRDLLLLSRADAGRLGQRPVGLLVSEVIRHAVAAVKRPDMAPISLDLGGLEWSVCGNQDELIRLFANLLDNAVRHTPPHGVISVTARADAGCIVIAVSDTGTGIAAEHLPHLGDRFYRADTSRSRHDGGTGLGLSICKSVAEAHHGSLKIESVLGAGTTVTITLPAGAPALGMGFIAPRKNLKIYSTSLTSR